MTRAALCMLLAVFSFVSSNAQPRRAILRDAAGQIVDSFVSIQGAYDAIPEPLTQAYAITIGQISGAWRGDSYPIRFRQKAGASAAHTITLRPDSPARTVSILIASRTDTSETFVFDGAHWVIIDGQGPDPEAPYCFRFRTRTSGATTRATFPAIRFVNGATHNTVRYFEGNNGLLNPAAPANESLILFDTSSAGRGNSDNTIEHAWLSGDRPIRSRGSSASPNERNLLRSNLFEPVDKTGVEIDEGTAGTVIADNEFWPDFAGNGPTELVRIKYLDDTTRITGNIFRLVSTIYSDSSALTGLCVNGAVPNAAGAVCLVSNNYFSNGGTFVNGKLAVSGVPPVDSFRKSMLAIDMHAGAGPLNAVIAHNTVRLLPTIAAGTSRVLQSAAFRMTGVNAGGAIAVLNNIFHDERSGGAAGSLHAALDISDTTGLALDYNSYRSVDSIAQISGRRFNDYLSYHSAHPLIDLHSDDSAVMFETPDSHYLSARMKDRPEIIGALTPAVPLDKDGYERKSGYRGADELAVTCDTAAYRAAVFPVSGSDVCAGGMVWMQYAGNSWMAPVLPPRGYAHQWQSRPLSTTTFTDIPGEFSANLVIRQTVPTAYRIKDSCLADNSVRYSNQSQVGINGIYLVIDSLSAAPVSGYTYEFEAHHSGPSTTYYWDFSDRQMATTTVNKVTVRFAGPGPYTATVRSLGDCSEAVSTAIVVADSSLNVASGPGGAVRVYPNPVAEQLMVHGAAGARLTLYSVIGVAVRQVSAASQKQRLNLEGLAPGSYVLKVQHAGGQVSVHRVVKGG